MLDRAMLLERVLESTSDGIVALTAVRGPDGVVQDLEWQLVNRAAERILGRTADELVGRRLRAEFPEAAHSEQWRTYLSVLETGTPEAVEHGRISNGVRLWWREMVTRMADGLVVTFQDVTDQREAQEQDATGFANAGDLMAQLTVDHRFMRLNPMWSEALGYADSDLMGRSFVELVAPEEQRHALRAAERGAPMFEVRISHRDGSWRRFVWSIVRTARSILLIGRDVTERREGERRLSDSEAHYRGLVEQSGTFLVRTGIDGRVTFANTAFAEALGRRPHELVGGNALIEALADGAAPDLMDAYQTLALPPHRTRLVLAFRHGQVLLEGMALRSPAGQVTGYQWTGVALPDEAAMCQTTDYAADILAGAPIAIAMTDAEGSFRRVNRQFAAFIGYAEEELSGMRMQEVTYAGDWDRELAARRDALAAGDDSYEIQKRYKRKDGQLVLAVTQVRLLRDPAGAPWLECSVTRDVGDAVRLEQQLERSRWRVEMIGRFVEGLAYDLKFLRRQRHASASEDSVLDLWDPARFDALLAFLDRRTQPEYDHVPPLAVVPVLEDRALAWQSRVEGRMRFTVEMREEGGAARILRDDMVELLDHLIGNACFAMETGGTLRLGLESVELPQLATDRFLHLFPGEYLQITVSDDGIGMAPEVAAKAWEPFFSAWSSRATTGVGLTLTRAIARRWDGDVIIESLPGFGTTVTVVIPRFSKAGAPQAGSRLATA